ncbi:MAG: hypothetical protein MRY78_11520 [Saprospiraceae bacterium]|nr:hypothetical protein [Saprospiraceae bacterium]
MKEIYILIMFPFLICQFNDADEVLKNESNNHKDHLNLYVITENLGIDPDLEDLINYNVEEFLINLEDIGTRTKRTERRMDLEDLTTGMFFVGSKIEVSNANNVIVFNGTIREYFDRYERLEKKYGLIKLNLKNLGVLSLDDYGRRIVEKELGRDEFDYLKAICQYEQTFLGVGMSGEYKDITIKNIEVFAWQSRGVWEVKFRNISVVETKRQ